MNSTDLTLVPSTRINVVESIETALKLLTSQGYSTADLWAEHRDWLDSIERREPSAVDRQWARQLPEPSTTEEHFTSGEPETLTAARCHVGRQYTLTPGQREILRDRFGLTPTLIVVATNVELFPADDLIYSLTLKSVEHVDPRRRTRVLNEVVIAPASHFFRDAAAKDKAREEEKDARAEAAAVSAPKLAKRGMLADYV